MVPYDLNQAIDCLERSFITGKIKVATGEVRKDIDLLRRIIRERELPAVYCPPDPTCLIQGQTKLYASLRGFTSCGRPDPAARFGRTAKLKDRWLVLIGLL